MEDLQNITSPTVTNLLISSINLLVAGFGPFIFLPRVSILAAARMPISMVFYSIGTSVERNHIVSQPSLIRASPSLHLTWLDFILPETGPSARGPGPSSTWCNAFYSVSLGSQLPHRQQTSNDIFHHCVSFVIYSHPALHTTHVSHLSSSQLKCWKGEDLYKGFLKGPLPEMQHQFLKLCLHSHPSNLHCRWNLKKKAIYKDHVEFEVHLVIWFLL